MGAVHRYYHILFRQSIPLLGCLLFFSYSASRAGTLQSFQASLDENPSLELSGSYQETPPKSSLEISSPDQGTVWTVSRPAQIEWETENIGTAKSIRFFLAKDDMVVQELGSFKNDSFADGIELAKNVGSGDNYQVVGIELFPDNKFQVAKYASPYFSIRNPEADARKATALAQREERKENSGDAKSQKDNGSATEGKRNRNSGSAKARDNNTSAKKKSRKEKRREAKARKENASVKVNPIVENRNQGVENRNMAMEVTPATNEFQGRKISYIKELSFANEEVSISLWDHGRQDGDIVSIYLNGETVVSKHLLTYRKKSIRFKLDAGRSNELFLYAHNLGKAPPNTVSIELTDGTTSEKIVLNSDLKRCEAVQIKVQ